MSFGKKFSKMLEVNSAKDKDTDVHIGFGKKKLWSSTGVYSLNKLLSGKYKKAFQYGRSVLIGGESGSGKSLAWAITAANEQRNNNAFIFWIDCEHASDEDWFEDAGLDTDPENFEKVEMGTVGNVKKYISNAINLYDKITEKEHRPMMIIIDSWSVLMSEKQKKEADEGKLVGDQGQIAKQIKDVIKAMGHKCARKDIILGGVVHTYESQDMFKPDEKFSGGRGLFYLASQVLLFATEKFKGKLAREFYDEYHEEGVSDSDVIGLRCRIKLFKSRFSKPNESIEILAVHGKGFLRDSGLFDMMKKDGIIEAVAGSKGAYTITEPYSAKLGTDFPEKFTKREFEYLADTLIDYLEPDENEETSEQMEIQEDE